MRVHEFLSELFDTPSAYEWTKRDDESWEATFKIDSVVYEFYANMNDPYDDYIEAEIEFFHRDSRGVPTHKKTGVGNEHKVFSTVINMVKEFIDAIQPDYLIFGAEEINRKSLYRRMVSSLVPGAVVKQSANKMFVSMPKSN